MNKYCPKHPMKYYLRNRWVRNYLNSETSMQKVVIRTVHFMDLTELQPSSMVDFIYENKDIPNKLGFDHTQMWHINRKYLYTTEPYGRQYASFEDNLKRNKTYFRKIKNYGLWNPPDASFYLIEIPNQLSIDPIADKIEQYMKTGAFYKL
mgnify:CR=1 FL=1